MSDFPLCKELGLEVIPNVTSQWGQGGSFQFNAIRAVEVEALLEKGVRVECQKLGESNLTDQHGPGWNADEVGMWSDKTVAHKFTHTALLINIKPIARDTAEGLLREYLAEYDKFIRGEHEAIPVTPWVERVKRLLK